MDTKDEKEKDEKDKDETEDKYKREPAPFFKLVCIALAIFC